MENYTKKNAESQKEFCKNVISCRYLRSLDSYTEGALIFRRGILDDQRQQFWIRLEIVFWLIMYASSPIASQFVDRQSFEERPSLLDLALARFTLAPFAARYLGIRGGLADAAGGGSLPV